MLATWPCLLCGCIRHGSACCGHAYYGHAYHGKVDDAGLHISLKGNPKKGEPPSSRVLEVDTVVVCAGQVSQRELEQPLQAPGVPGSPSRKP